MTREAIEFLDQAKDVRKPFFLYLATTLDHGPHANSRSLAEDPRLTPAGILEEPQFADIIWPYDQYAGYHMHPYRPGGTTLAAVRNYFGTIYDRDQLYDLETDPRERRNLANHPEYRETLLSMQDLLRRELAPLPGSFGEFKQLTSEEATAWKAEHARRHPGER